MENKKTPIDWLMEQITYDDGGRRLASWIESVDLKPYFDKAQQMYYQELLQSNIEGGRRMQEMIITVNNDGNKQICSFSENKIKHITQTNQWGYVIETILQDSIKK
jgi:hypothetical protein